ncbi:MAG TPA: glycosyltransferase family 2 protein [Candidatus Limnocylindria bacterium]|jgi:glycosyltransferase involved in cell wall biosynthesis
MTLELSIVMPCLDEAKTVGECVGRARAALQRLQIAGEVIVADNGSTDGSPAIAERAGARVVPVAARGYGAALAAGIAAARGTYVLMGDADLTYDFNAIDPFVARLRAGDDLVMGNRFRGGVEKGAMPFLHRWLGNPVLSFLGRLFYRTDVGDFHCGLRAFRRDSIERLDLRSTGMEYATEMVAKSALYGMRVSEVPATLAADVRDRAPHLRTWRDGWRHLRFMLLYSPRWLFLYPGALLMLVGALVTLWLLPGAQQSGNVTFDVHTLVYAALAMIVGFQAVVFALFTKTFAITEGLLPPDPRLDRLYRHVTLETGLVVGSLVSLAGLAGSFYAVGLWQARAFGPLEQTALTLRVVIVSGTAIALGIETVLASFFLSVLGLRRR